MGLFSRNKPSVESLGALMHQADLKKESGETLATARESAAEATKGDVRARSKEMFTSLFANEANISRDKSFFGRMKEKFLGWRKNREGQAVAKMKEAESHYGGKNYLAEAQSASQEAQTGVAAVAEKATSDASREMTRGGEVASSLEALNRAIRESGAYKEVKLEKVA